MPGSSNVQDSVDSSPAYSPSTVHVQSSIVPVASVDVSVNCTLWPVSGAVGTFA